MRKYNVDAAFRHTMNGQHNSSKRLFHHHHHDVNLVNPDKTTIKHARAISILRSSTVLPAWLETSACQSL